VTRKWESEYVASRSGRLSARQGFTAGSDGDTPRFAVVIPELAKPDR
jgi:hypothetical protein